jgi:hypothetical protein
MPLKRGRGLPVAQADAIYFPMQDVHTNAPVQCKVAYAFLASCYGASYALTPGRLPPWFSEVRKNIEEIASRKYDAGESAPFLIRGDNRGH